jgi:serralysin
MPALTGTANADTLIGDATADTLAGGAGGDRLSGDIGFDLFVVGSGDSPASGGLADPATIDVITDWSARDRLFFVGGQAPVFGSVGQGLAESYQQAYDQAVGAFGGGRIYFAAQVGGDVYVFSIGTGQAVQLLDARLEDVQRFQFVTGSFDGGLIETGADGGVVRTLADGADRFAGGTGSDTISGLGGSDTLGGGAGDDQAYGGVDNDSITGGDGANYLRGDEGDDQVLGGAGFDDINGNMGRDTLSGGDGTDWVVGGKDDDIAFGEDGDDIVYGNLGNDTVGGGKGHDIVRGGQGDDLVRGDEGADTLAGDLGNDTIDGGLGADVFISFATTGLDKIVGFNAGEGDRVRLDPGTTFTIDQADADVVVNLGFNNRIIMEGVNLQTLPDGWIFVAG